MLFILVKIILLILLKISTHCRINQTNKALFSRYSFFIFVTSFFPAIVCNYTVQRKTGWKEIQKIKKINNHFGSFQSPYNEFPSWFSLFAIGRTKFEKIGRFEFPSYCIFCSTTNYRVDSIDHSGGLFNGKLVVKSVLITLLYFTIKYNNSCTISSIKNVLLFHILLILLHLRNIKVKITVKISFFSTFFNLNWWYSGEWNCYWNWNSCSREKRGEPEREFLLYETWFLLKLKLFRHFL